MILKDYNDLLMSKKLNEVAFEEIHLATQPHQSFENNPAEKRYVI